MSRAPDSFSVSSEVMSPSSFCVLLGDAAQLLAEGGDGIAAIG